MYRMVELLASEIQTRLENETRKSVGFSEKKTHPKARIMQMKWYVPEGRSVETLGAVGPCWITYDSSLPVEERVAVISLRHSALLPCLLTACDDGSAVLVAMTPGQAPPEELLRLVSGGEPLGSPTGQPELWPGD